MFNWEWYNDLVGVIMRKLFSRCKMEGIESLWRVIYLIVVLKVLKILYELE